MNRRQVFILLALAAALPDAYAQSGKWPDKPVRVVVPFAPGGGTDIVARLISARLSEAFGQQFVVDNRGGAGGIIGTEIAAKAAPDGYTLCTVSASYSANPAVKAHSLQEFLALARAKPEAINFGSSGTGSSIHLAFELFRQLTQIPMQHIPYKGTGPALTDLLGGQIQLMFSSAPAAIPQIKAGKLRALAVTTEKRARSMPELPAIGEQVAGFQYSSWYGMWATAGTPKDTIGRLNRALAQILVRPELQERLRADGVEPAHSTPEEFARLLDREIATWIKVVKAGNIKVE